MDGDPSGIRWWNNQRQGMGTDSMNSSGLAVFPLYRANTANLYDSWIAVHIEMTGSKTENCLWVCNITVEHRMSHSTFII